MKIIKKAILAAYIIVISFLFVQCRNSPKYNRDLFIGSWREARHTDRSFDDRYSIELKLNADNSYSLDIPSEKTSLSGTWSLGGFDTTTIIALKYQYSVKEMDANYYGGSTFPMYYLFKVNNATKGKLYLVNMSSRYQDENIKEHLFKPQE
jgi:hypothetical protein